MKKGARKSKQKEAVVEEQGSVRLVRVGEIEMDVRAEFRELIIAGGLRVAAALFEDEMTQLCGPRYARGSQWASRWGRQRREFALGGRKVTIQAPRARRNGVEVVPALYAELQREDALSERALEQMLVGVSTRKYARSLEPINSSAEPSAMSKSAVSRRFVARTEAQLEAVLAKPLGGTQWAALMVDGIGFHDHLILIALGIDVDGYKHLLGFRQGTTENATVCRELLADLVGRGLPADRSILVGIDGGKGLASAVVQVFGQHAVVQRCQVHKKRNVLDHLPERLRAKVSEALSEAYAMPAYEAALAALEKVAADMEKQQPSAASSLREGMKQTLAVKKLGLTGRLAKTLETTNPIENLNGGVRRVSGRVKRCRDGSMARRWVVTAALEAAKGFRRIKGHRDLPKLVAALKARDAEFENASVRRAV